MVFYSVSVNEEEARRYVEAASQAPLLAKEEEIALARAMRQGDEDARRRIVAANLRLVVSIARRYVDEGLPLPSGLDAGNRGLNEAAEHFDHTKGFGFSTYATSWIRQAITRRMAEGG